jgi:hypothetical protein
MMIKILDAMCCLWFENFREATLRLSMIVVVEDPALISLVRQSDLA